MSRTFTLTKDQAEEVLHKMGIYQEESELQESDNLTQQQADELYNSIPRDGGDWVVPDWGLEAVMSEMADHVKILQDMAYDAATNGIDGDRVRGKAEAAKTRRFATLFERVFGGGSCRHTLQDKSHCQCDGCRAERGLASVPRDRPEMGGHLLQHPVDVCISLKPDPASLGGPVVGTVLKNRTSMAEAAP